MLERDPHDARRLLDAARPHHQVGPSLGVERLVVTVLSEDVRPRADPVGAEQFAQRPPSRLHGLPSGTVQPRNLYHAHEIKLLTPALAGG